MQAMRTPDSRFESLPGYPYNPKYFETQGLRVHYVDEGSSDRVTYLCLHGEPTWSYLYRKMIPPLAQRGRVLAPDLVGFGKSDKPARVEDYSFRLHFDILVEFLKQTRATNVVLICQDWGGLLGLPLAMELESIFKGLVIMNTGIPDPTSVNWLEPKNILGGIGFMAWRTFAVTHPDLPIGQIVSAGSWPPLALNADVRRGYDAPFPDKSFKAGADAFPRLVPISADHPTLPYMQRARQRIEKSELPKLVLFSNRDPITWSQKDYFSRLKNVVADIQIQNAGHFLQEDKGEEIAEQIIRYF
ncbi:MAG: haloalkane dehalogenase [Spirochaetota bacterium]